MLQKIRVLLQLVNVYENRLEELITRYMALGKHIKMKHIHDILRYTILFVSLIPSDKDWYTNIRTSFNKAILNDESPQKWLYQQLEEFNIFPVSDFVNVFERDSLTMVLDLLDFECPEYLSAHHVDIAERIADFLKSYKVISPTDLCQGDLIVYKNSNELKHTALFVGKGGDKRLYATSKFGQSQGLYIHPLNKVPENYGVPSYYRSRRRLSSRSKACLEMIELLLLANTSKLWKSKNSTLFSSEKINYGDLLRLGTQHAKLFPEETLFLKSLNQRNYKLALIAACSAGRYLLVKNLLEFCEDDKDFNINASSLNEKNALTWARESRAPKEDIDRIIDLLLEYGAKDELQVPTLRAKLL